VSAASAGDALAAAASKAATIVRSFLIRILSRGAAAEAKGFSMSGTGLFGDRSLTG
jgi:hypothetical protein